jgi:hypothetical protein
VIHNDTRSTKYQIYRYNNLTGAKLAGDESQYSTDMPIRCYENNRKFESMKVYGRGGEDGRVEDHPINWNTRLTSTGSFKFPQPIICRGERPFHEH